MQYEDKRPKAADVAAALQEWFPAGFATDRAAFEAALKAPARGAAGGKEPPQQQPDWGALGRTVFAGRLEDVGGAPAIELRHVKLAEAPAWFKVGGWVGGRAVLRLRASLGALRSRLGRFHKGWSQRNNPSTESTLQRQNKTQTFRRSCTAASSRC